MKEKMPLGIAITIVAVFVGFLVWGTIHQSRISQLSISNFDECVAAGNPVMESYPEQCITRDGRHFVNKGHSVDDTALVEQYIRAHIAEIAPEQTVLGGIWYVTNIFVNPSTKTGSVSYEDGHIMGTADFSYVITGGQVTVTSITKK